MEAHRTVRLSRSRAPVMSLQLRPDVSFCEVDGHLVFLDIGNDRYFRLPDVMERRFIAHQHGDCADADLGRLVDAGLLIDSGDACGPVADAPMPGPTRSAMEHESAAAAVAFSDLIDAVRIVMLSQFLLRTRPLAHVLRRLSADRERRAGLVLVEPGAAVDHRLATTAAAFLRARPYAPIETCCLVDSISLIRFMASRHLAAHLVFAVTGAPFSAHCWVQVGELVLNDTVGNTHAHTPIRIV